MWKPAQQSEQGFPAIRPREMDRLAARFRRLGLDPEPALPRVMGAQAAEVVHGGEAAGQEMPGGQAADAGVVVHHRTYPPIRFQAVGDVHHPAGGFQGQGIVAVMRKNPMQPANFSFRFRK
jgi:hypothetical protein